MFVTGETSSPSRPIFNHKHFSALRRESFCIFTVNTELATINPALLQKKEKEKKILTTVTNVKAKTEGDSDKAKNKHVLINITKLHFISEVCHL